MVTGLITQNVDRLHQQAGSRRVVELHGALADVLCLGCGGVRGAGRAAGSPAGAPTRAGSRGRRRWPPTATPTCPTRTVAAFRVPACLGCGGVLKPDVVFFGGNVGATHRGGGLGAGRRGAELLLVVGSSLAVYSGYRFVLRAKERGMRHRLC